MTAPLLRKAERPVRWQLRIEWGSVCAFFATSVIACRTTVFSHALEVLWMALCLLIVARGISRDGNKTVHDCISHDNPSDSMCNHK